MENKYNSIELKPKYVDKDVSHPRNAQYLSQRLVTPASTSDSFSLNIAKIDMNARILYEGWNFNSGNYLFTTDTK